MPSTIVRTKDRDISSSVPSIYQNLLQSNPYRGLTYTKSPWQNFLSKIGFRTQADAWQENMQVQANEYDAALLEKIQEEQYNDPSSQVARMKQAGLNPDIDPSSIDSGSASQLGDDPSTPMLSTDEEGVINTVANGCMSAISTALGLFSNIQGIQRNRLDNLSKEFSLFGDLTPNFLVPSPHPEGIENYDWKAASLDNAKKFAGNLPKKMQKRFIDYQEQFWNSAIGENESYEDFSKRISSRKGYEMNYQTLWSELPDVLSKITNPLAAAAEKIYKSGQTAQIKQNEAAEIGAAADIAGSQTEIAYQNELNGQVMAQAQNAENEAEANKNSTIAILQGAVNDIMKGLDSASQDGGLKGALAQVAKIGISGLYLWLSSQGAPSISRSESNHRSSWSKQGGFSEGSSSGFSIGF